jgi:hypothetical protein
VRLATLSIHSHARIHGEPHRRHDTYGHPTRRGLLARPPLNDGIGSTGVSGMRCGAVVAVQRSRGVTALFGELYEYDYYHQMYDIQLETTRRARVRLCHSSERASRQHEDPPLFDIHREEWRLPRTHSRSRTHDGLLGLDATVMRRRAVSGNGPVFWTEGAPTYVHRTGPGTLSLPSTSPSNILISYPAEDSRP